MDIRLKMLSYSSRLKLHECARKYELYKIGNVDIAEDEDGTSALTFNYGHVVGAGVQDCLEGKSEDAILWNAFLGWKADLFEVDEKRGKSFFGAVIGIKKFLLISNSLLKDYELVEYQGRPAVELSFCITFPDGFLYRGHVDAVLKNKKTGEILVLECKTTGFSSVNPASYKNSDQAIGYSIVLDAIFGSYSSYKVLYPIYKTKDMEWELLPFIKTPMQRAEWIKALIFDHDDIVRYEENNLFPMRGESCVNKYHRDCEYLQTCSLKREHLTKKMTAEEEEELGREKEKYQIVLTLDQLIESQIHRNQ